MDGQHVKPPLGVYPEFFWRQDRAIHLAKAIHEHVAGGFIGGAYADLLLEWTHELNGFLRWSQGQRPSAK